MAKRRTKKQYTELYDKPGTLFPGAEVILWPNGQPEIMIRAENGKYGLVIRRASGSRTGLGFEIWRLPGTPEINLAVNETENGGTERLHHIKHAWSIDLFQYNPHDEWAQAFRAWYFSDPNPDNAASRPPHPGTREEWEARQRAAGQA